MSSTPQSIKKGQMENIGASDLFYGQPDVILLDEKQWLYIQRRYHMTPRELQITQLVCQGLTNGDIARKLKIKAGTVKTHLRSIFGKTRVRNKITMLLKFMDDVSKLFGEHESVNTTPFT